MRCTVCKGKGLCGRLNCPILERLRAFETMPSIKDSLFGNSPPSVFVGRMGYPKVGIGPLVPAITDAEISRFDNPASWGKLKIEDVIGMRSSLVRSSKSFNVKAAQFIENSKILSMTQELALADKPVETEVWFLKPPKKDLKFDGILTPMGPSGTIDKLAITENPSVERKVEYITSDTDIKAKLAVDELYRGGISVYQIMRLFSVGLLGERRKLVPTRWSITATDDIIGKRLIDLIRDYPVINDTERYSFTHFENHFEILLFPAIFSFELLEIWRPLSLWAEKGSIEADREGYKGRSRYSELGGGYYAARLGVLEHLDARRRQATAIILREIYPSYWAPLGVWVVREAVREALRGKPEIFTDPAAALAAASSRIKTPKMRWQNELKIFDVVRHQRTLSSFFFLLLSLPTL